MSYTLQVLTDRLSLLEQRAVRDEAEEAQCKEAISDLEMTGVRIPTKAELCKQLRGLLDNSEEGNQVFLDALVCLVETGKRDHLRPEVIVAGEHRGREMLSTLLDVMELG